MAKKTNKTNKRSAETAYRIQRTASLCGVSTRTVYRAINADTNNEEVFTTYMELMERDHSVIEDVAKLIPFYPKKSTAK